MPDRERAAARVMLLDGDRHALGARVDALRRAGLNADGYETISDALASALAAPPAVIVIDLERPDADGFGFAMQLRADCRTSALPVIALTAAWTAEIRSRAARAGIGVLLLEPCAADHLLAEIERALQPLHHWGSVMADPRRTRAGARRQVPLSE